MVENLHESPLKNTEWNRTKKSSNPSRMIGTASSAMPKRDEGSDLKAARNDRAPPRRASKREPERDEDPDDNELQP